MPQADQVTAANYDAKKYKICCPWNGKREAVHGPSSLKQPSKMVAEPKWINLLHGTKCLSLIETDIGSRHGANHPNL